MNKKLNALCLIISASLFAKDLVPAEQSVVTVMQPVAPLNKAAGLDQLLELDLPGSDAPAPASPLRSLRVAPVEEEVSSPKVIATRPVPVKVVKPTLPAAMREQMEVARTAEEDEEAALKHEGQGPANALALRARATGMTGSSSKSEHLKVRAVAGERSSRPVHELRSGLPSKGKKKDASAIIEKFRTEHLMEALNEVDRLKAEVEKLDAHLEAVLKQPYSHEAVGGALAAWGKTYAALEEAEKTAEFLQHLPVHMENPVTMLTASIAHDKETAALMERANFDLVSCAIGEYNKGAFRSLFGNNSEQIEQLRFLKHSLTSYHAAQIQWYRNVLNRLNDLWLLSGAQYIAQKNREIKSIDAEYIATSGDDFISGRHDKEIGWHMTMPLPEGDHPALNITVESIEKQKDDIRTFAGAVNPHELIRQRKHDWERAQKMVKAVKGEARKSAERFAEMMRQAYERDAGRLEVQTRMKWVVSDISKVKAQIMSIDDDDPDGKMSADPGASKAALKTLQDEMARFQSSMFSMGDFMVGRFIQGVKKHTKRIEGLGKINDEVNAHLSWLRKNSSSSLGTAISGVEWALRSQTANQLL